jgi:hypothetical protein
MVKREVVPEIPKDLIKYLLVIISLSLLLVYGIFIIKIDIQKMMVILGLILMGAVSRLPQRLSPVSFGLELVTLATISGAILYGPFVGALIGVFAMGLSGFYTIEPPQDIVVAAAAFIGVSYAAVPLYVMFGSLGMTALVITVAYDLLTGVAYSFLGHSPMGSVRFAVLHIPSNYLILQYIGPRIIAI